MSTDQRSISKAIAYRFRDAIAKIQADAARQVSDHEAQLSAQFNTQLKEYQDHIAELTASLEEATRAHAREIKQLKAQSQRKLRKEKLRADEATELIDIEKIQIGKAITKQKRILQTESDILIAQITSDCDKQICEAKRKLKKETLRADEATELIETEKARIAKATTEQKHSIQSEADHSIAKIKSDCDKKIRQAKTTCQGEIDQIKAQTNEQFYTQQLALAEEEVNKAIALLEPSQAKTQ